MAKETNKDLQTEADLLLRAAGFNEEGRPKNECKKAQAQFEQRKITHNAMGNNSR